MTKQRVQRRLAAQFDDLGERRVKNISRPVHVYRVLSDPDAETTTVKNAPGRPLPDRPSVACLRFKNLGDDQSQVFPADAIRLAIHTKDPWYQALP